MADFPAVIFARGGDWGGIVQFIVVALFIVGPFLLKRFTASQQSDDAAPAQENPDDAERVRKIREEVARRAAQQREKSQQSQTPSPRRVSSPPPPVPSPQPAVTWENFSEQADGGDDNAAMLAELESAKKRIAEAQQKANALLQNTAANSSAEKLFQNNNAAPVHKILRDKQTLRAAIVTQEILSPPLALREGSDPLRRQ